MLHTVYRDPFALGSPHISQIGEGFTLYEIVSFNSHLPKDFLERGSVTINGDLVPREYWKRVRPKTGTIISMHDYIGGGAGGGGKQVFGLIAAIALTVVTGGISAGLLAPVLGAGFAAGTIGAAVLSGVVGIAGALAIQALTPPPTAKPGAEQKGAGLRLEAASIDGNLLEANAPVPRVIGTRRMFPPFLTEPIIELIGQDEIVEAVWGLAGPHALEDIRLGDASIDLESADATDIEIEVRNGLPGDIPVTLTERQGRTTEPNIELSVHTVDPENQDTLQGADPLPVFHAVTTRIDPDENWIHLNLQGLARQDATGSLRIPIRLRMRRRGDTLWRDLPEIHYQNETQSSVRLQIKIYWGEAYTSAFPPVPSTIGFVSARKLVPAQNVQPLGTIFESDAYFSAGAGNDILVAGTELTTNLRNVVLFAEHADIYLSAADWTPGIYDIEIKRGATLVSANFTSSTYTYSGSILNFFGRTDAGELPVTREGLLDSITLVRLVNVWNEHPIVQAGMTLIALTARNRSVKKLSVIASGYVKDLPQGRGPVTARSSGTNRTVFTYDAAGTMIDPEVLIFLRPTLVVDEGEIQGTPMLRVGGAAATETGYRATLRLADATNTARLEINKFAPAFTVIATTPFPVEEGRNYFIRFQVRGSALKAKVWSAALSEPDDWTLETTDTAFTSGRVGIFFNQLGTDASSSINWFSASDGDTAPSPPDLATLATDFSSDTLGANPSGWTNFWVVANATFLVTENAMFPYNGKQTDWNEFRVTSNPAAHFRDVLTGAQNFDPLPEELLDDTSIIDWWRRCAASDFTCDMVVEGLEVPDLLRVVASCGFGRLYRSELFGVIQDFDRSGDTPTQVFSPRNSSGLSWRKAFSRLPAGFRINFREFELDYGNDQVVVYRTGAEGSSNRLEQVTYDGLIREADVIRRARFDLLQAERRAAFYSLNAPSESIVCRRGDLIGVTHDILQSQYGYARIADVIYDEDEITGIILDAPIEVVTEEDVLDVYDMLEVEDVLALGITTGVAIRLTNGQTTTHGLSTVSGLTDELEFTTPIPIRYGHNSTFDRHPIHTVAPGCLVVAGVLGSEYKRLVVSEISPQINLEAQLVCVDEASEMFGEVFGVSV